MADFDGCDKPTTRTASYPFDDSEADHIIRSSDDIHVYLASDKSTARTASYPFDDPKADFIILSSDNILFYIHKLLLSIVSPVFEDLLTLPHEIYDDRPCLPINDDSSHLSCLLSWCDRRSEKQKPTLDNLTMMLTMAKKYGVDPMLANAENDLLAHCSIASLRVYTIAIRFQLYNVVQKAAQATLQLSLACHDSPDLKHISALSIQNLHNYHFKCKEAIRDLLASESWAAIMRGAVRHLMLGTKHTHGDEHFSLKRSKIARGRALWLSTEHTAFWWFEYMETMAYILNEQPSVSPPLLLRGMRASISLDECNECSKHGYGRLNAVSIVLVKKINEAISEVPFEVKY